MIPEKDYDAEIAQLLKRREEYQTQFDKSKNTYDDCRTGALKRAILETNWQLRDLIEKKAASKPAENFRGGGSVFYGSN